MRMLEPTSLVELHGVKDNTKFASIVESMKENGWVGRPIAAQDTGNGIFALTGSHRIAAARVADIAVPCYVYEGELDLTAAVDDDERLEMAEESGDQELVDLLDFEVYGE